MSEFKEGDKVWFISQMPQFFMGEFVEAYTVEKVLENPPRLVLNHNKKPDEVVHSTLAFKSKNEMVDNYISQIVARIKDES